MKTISLNGIWSLRGSSGNRGGFGEWPFAHSQFKAFEAKVPGTVQEALSFMTGEPAEGHNSLNARWEEEEYWLWSRSFTLDAEDIAKRVRIVFEGLDLNAKIYVNNALVGTHANFFMPCRIDITPFIREGENKLDVILESGLFANADKSIEHNHPTQMAVDMKLHKRTWMRKPQSSCEWDWAPRLITVGIYKPCRLELSEGLFADEASVFADVSADYKTGTVEIRQFMSVSGGSREYSLTAAAEGCEPVSVTGTADGSSPAHITLKFDSPKLWNPRGYGRQDRYDIRLTLKSGDEIISDCVRKVGFRRAEIIQDPHPDGGFYFIVNVNGNNIFAKGGNLVPSDIIYSRITDEVYETIIDRAVEANFNALRIWGGGLYEGDRFYDLCDEKGIIIWHDFITACAGYPGNNDGFYCNYRNEITYQIRRLSNCAGIVFWSGNNEIDWQIALFNEAPGAVRYPDANLYYYLLPRTLKAEGDKRYYQPSSPYSPDYTDDNSDIVGDQHPWGVSMVEYEGYRNSVSRFSDEGGVLGPTSLPNTMKCLSAGQEYVRSYDWQHHDNAVAHSSGSPIAAMLKNKLGLELDMLSIPEYIAYLGFLQGEGLTEYILNYRRRMYSSASAIFWMYNDCWPCTSSWTAVDYMRNRTPAFYPIKRSFEPVAVDIIVNPDGRLTVYGINETLSPVSARLEYGAFGVAGGYKTEFADVMLPANASVIIAEYNAADAMLPYAVLTADGYKPVSRRIITGPYTALGLKKPDIRVTYDMAAGTATYTCDVFVAGVCIDLDGDKPLGDNFFDLYPGRSHTVDLAGTPGKVLFTANTAL